MAALFAASCGEGGVAARGEADMAESLSINLILNPGFDPGRKGPLEPGPIVEFMNHGAEAVDLDLFDTLWLESSIAGGAWHDWSHGRNASRPGPHRELIGPGGKVRRELPCASVWTDEGWTLDGTDWTGTRWWIGPVRGDDAGGVEVLLRAVLRVPGGNVVRSEAVRLVIRRG